MEVLLTRSPGLMLPSLVRTMAVVLSGIALPSVLLGQQVADTAFRPPIAKPAYHAGQGPVVLIDEGHNNFHTASGRYLPFANLLRRDGYVVVPLAGKLTSQALRAASVLVIANSQRSPDRPAFALDEVAALRDWVAAGGSLLLIGDHPPFSEGAAQLGKEFGVQFRQAGARDPTIASGRLIFRRSDRTLIAHRVTAGVDSVATFTGSSFQLESAGEPLLVFGPGAYSFRDPDDPDPEPLGGHLQGALLRFQQGRVAVFAEAAMFSAQRTGPDQVPMGMNAPIASQNWQFLLNLLHWLTGALPPDQAHYDQDQAVPRYLGEAGSTGHGR